MNGLWKSQRVRDQPTLIHWIKASTCSWSTTFHDKLKWHDSEKAIIFPGSRVTRVACVWDSLIFGASYFGLLHRQQISENLQTYPFLCTEMTGVVLNRISKGIELTLTMYQIDFSLSWIELHRIDFQFVSKRQNSPTII